MERIWAPWRIEYIENKKPLGCIFCLDTRNECEPELLLLNRTPFSFVMMNRYPYTNGHLLIAPHRHCAELAALGEEEMLDLFRQTQLCCSILKQYMNPQGFNVGMNLGKAAGAGVDEHLHIHVVPRWNGDSNFMTVLGDLRVMPENLLATYYKILPGFAAMGAATLL